MKRWCIEVGAVLTATLWISCGDMESADDGPFDTIELRIGDVPTDMIAVDWGLYDDEGSLLTSGSVGPPLQSNQTVARYHGAPRSNMYMRIEPFLTGGTSCGVVETPRFSSSDPDVVFVVGCGSGQQDFSALIIFGDLGPVLTNTGLTADDYGAPDSYELSVGYDAEVVDASLAGYSLHLFWATDLTRTWTLNTSTGFFGNGIYEYDVATGRFTFRDPTDDVCAEYDYDVTVGELNDLPRVLTLDLVSSDPTCAFGAIDISGVWTSTTPLP